MSEEAAHETGVSPERLRAYFAERVDRIERKKSIMAAAMAECREVNEEEKRALKMVIAEGANKDGLKLEIKIHDIKYAASVQIRNRLDDEEDKVLQAAQAIRKAYGPDLQTLGLFAAAIERADQEADEAAARKASKAAKPKAAGRKKKDAPEAEAAATAAPAAPAANDDQRDLRPPFLRGKAAEEARAAEAAERLKGIKPLDQQTAH